MTGAPQRSVALTNLERVLWPETGFTKGDMLGYYEQISPSLLPHLRQRPVTLARFPTGVHEKGWYQTNCRGHPDWLPVARVPGRRGQEFEMCLINDVDALTWVVNQGTVELHPFLALADRPDNPLALVFDLDPGPPAGLSEACRVALAIHRLLGEHGLRARAKTSGSVGLHLYVGLASDTTFAETRAFARSVAGRLSADGGTLVTDDVLAARAGRVLIDWRQNEGSRSTIAPYSLRATPWPLVSAPLDWDEVEAAAATDARHLVLGPRAVLERVRDRGDLFASVLEPVHRLPPVTPDVQSGA